MQLEIEKWHACHNDFVVIWVNPQNREMVNTSLRRQAVNICDRRSGVGADGILSMCPRDSGTYSLLIINSDGSVADNCGNGLRCATLSAHRRFPNQLDMGTGALEVVIEGAHQSHVFASLIEAKRDLAVAIDMPIPICNEDLPWFSEAQQAVSALWQEFSLPEQMEVGCCEIGNPHIIITMEDEWPRDLIAQIGPRMQEGFSWDGVNVHLVRNIDPTPEDDRRAQAEVCQSIDKVAKVDVWERGAGRTMACGSGACAITACGRLDPFADRERWLAVDMPGGRLYCYQENQQAPVRLAGPATFVFSGTLSI